MSKEHVITELNRLIQTGELLIFNPDSHEIWGEDQILYASLNGLAVQITLAPGTPLPLWLVAEGAAHAQPG